MAYDAPLPRLGAFDGSVIPFVENPAMPRAVVKEQEWRSFDRRDRIGAWDALAEWACEPNPFYESWHLLPSLRAFDQEGDVTLLALEADG